MEILTQEKYSDIITWLPHGRGFVILQKKRFANEIMPKYFNKKSKFTSFTRKLNRWYVLYWIRYSDVCCAGWCETWSLLCGRPVPVEYYLFNTPIFRGHLCYLYYRKIHTKLESNI